MMPLHMVLAFLSAHVAELRRDNRDDGQRGADLVTTVIMISLFAAAAIVIVGILVVKARTAANNVKTQ